MTGVGATVCQAKWAWPGDWEKHNQSKGGSVELRNFEREKVKKKKSRLNVKPLRRSLQSAPHCVGLLLFICLFFNGTFSLYHFLYDMIKKNPTPVCSWSNSSCSYVCCRLNLCKTEIVTAPLKSEFQSHLSLFLSKFYLFYFFFKFWSWLHPSKGALWTVDEHKLPRCTHLVSESAISSDATLSTRVHFKNWDVMLYATQLYHFGHLLYSISLSAV